jgi:hypothetical protein
VATAETEQAWLEVAEGKTVREVERAVSGRVAGDLPTDAPDLDLALRALRYEVTGGTKSLMAEARKALTASTGHHLSDDEFLALLARTALGGPVDEGRSSYQVAIADCPTCRRVTQEGGGEEVDLEPEVAEMVRCDAQHLGRVEGGGAEAPTPHVGRPSIERASQSIPPATRRLVLRRQKGCCAVPGCRNHVFVDLHHIDTRAEGGTHDPERLVGLCFVHHRHAHDGRLVLRGTYSTGFTFHRADGTAYGGRLLAPERVDTHAQAWSALRHLGFKEREARAMLDAVAPTHVGADTAELVRAALRAGAVTCVRESLAPYLPCAA